MVKVYDVFPWLMYGQVREPCLELQRNVQAGGLPGVLSLLASFARTRRSRRFGERQKGTTGTSLKIFLKRWIAEWVVVGKTSYTWPGGRLILLAEILAYKKSATDTWASRAIIGQRGTLPVTPLGYLNPKKVIFRTMRTMRKQFPVNWLTSGRFSAPKRGGVNK